MSNITLPLSDIVKLIDTAITTTQESNIVVSRGSKHLDVSRKNAIIYAFQEIKNNLIWRKVSKRELPKEDCECLITVEWNIHNDKNRPKLREVQKAIYTHKTKEFKIHDTMNQLPLIGSRIHVDKYFTIYQPNYYRYKKSKLIITAWRPILEPYNPDDYVGCSNG